MIEDLFRKGTPTRLIAAINVSPESFHAGSVAGDAGSLVAAVRAAEANGASIIDIGAMSTAPYKETQISGEEEARRMRPALESARRATRLPLSADTHRSAVARMALDLGASIINDVTALRGDPALGTLCAERDAGMILMANDDPALDEAGESPSRVVRRLLEEALARAASAGIPTDRLLLDPGIGFFRQRTIPWHEWDIEVLRNIAELSTLPCPIVVGASRKSFIAELTGAKSPADRLPGSLAVATWCMIHGVEWLRVHDVRETRQAVLIARRLTGH